MSPVNWPSWCTVSVLGWSPEQSMISTAPDLTIKNLKSRSPTAKSVCPSRYLLGRAEVQRPKSAICASLRTGKATDWRVFSAMIHTASKRGTSVRRQHEELRVAQRIDLL